MHPQLKRLVHEKHLSPGQATIVHRNWADSPSDLWADPRVRSLNDHTAAYIDRIRGQFDEETPSSRDAGGKR